MTYQVVILMLTPSNFDPTKHLCHVTLISAFYWKVIENKIRRNIIFINIDSEHVLFNEVNLYQLF